MSNPRRPQVLFLMSGSIACYKACDLISRLVKRGHAVRTVASAGALRFVGEATLEGLTGWPVFTDLYRSGQAIDHIRLARWADLALVCPATANTLNRLAAGLADDAIGALYLAWEITAKPWLIAPAMNAAMWDHPATRASRQALVGHGARLLPVGAGALACGESGEGRLLEIAELEAEALAALATPQ
jgi:phosphopantothenoylcysteine decarboxylase/phosphopantothenate--cysteine ligase